MVNLRTLGAVTGVAVISLLACGGGAGATETTAPTGPSVVELERPWQVARVGRVTGRTRHLRIEYVTGDCDLDGRDPYFRRVEVKRSKRRIVLTVVVAKPPPPPADTACPAIGLIVRKRVDLDGSLGRRQLRDGSYTPPRLVRRR